MFDKVSNVKKHIKKQHMGPARNDSILYGGSLT